MNDMNAPINKIQRIVLIISLLFSLYMVVGGISSILINEKFEAALALPKATVEKGNERFHNVEHQIANAEYVKMKQIFPIYDWEILSYILTLMAFGLLGSIIKILIMDLKNDTNFNYSDMYSALVLGACLGLLTIVVSEVLPEFKSKSGNDKVFYTTALACGVFTLEIFEWLKKRFTTFLNKTPKPAPPGT